MQPALQPALQPAMQRAVEALPWTNSLPDSLSAESTPNFTKDPPVAANSRVASPRAFLRRRLFEEGGRIVHPVARRPHLARMEMS